MSIKTILAGIGALALIGELSVGLASSASASVRPLGLASSSASVRPLVIGPPIAGPGSTGSELHYVNWAGYVNTRGGTFASANWAVPSVHGAGGRYSCSWVGLDGSGSPTVEQTGIEMALIYGVPVYTAWVELYPAPMQFIEYTATGAEVPVSPGDHVSGSVSVNGMNGDNYTIKLTDHTQNWKFAWTVADPSGTNASAEAITEAPGVNGNQSLLADFSNEHFTSVHLSGHATRTTMVARNGQTKAYVTGSQRNFTVHFRYAGVGG